MGTISDRDPILASAISDPAAIRFGVDKPGDDSYQLSLLELSKSLSTYGTVVVQHADGTQQVFVPAANTRAARGAALVSAAAALTTRSAANLPGSSLYLTPGADYEVTDLTITSKHGVSIFGNNNTIWNAPGVDYDHILRFTTCDDVLLSGVTAQGDAALDTPADPTSISNTGEGQGIRFQDCNRPHVRNCESHSATGGVTSANPFAYNCAANGLSFYGCDDIRVDGYISYDCGNAGLYIVGDYDRCVIDRAFILNAQNRSAQVSPLNGGKFLTVRNSILYSDKMVDTTSADTDWFAYLPYIDFGNTANTTELVVMENVTQYWRNPSGSTTAAGSGYPLLKFQEVETVRMSNCVLYHGAAFTPGTSTPFAPYTTSIVFQNTLTPTELFMENVYMSLDMRNFGGATYPVNINASKSMFGQDQTHNGTFYQFGSERAVFDRCLFGGWTSYVFDMLRTNAGYLEVQNSKFVGPGATSNVLRPSHAGNPNAISTWAGNFLFRNNEYVTCRPASTAEDRLLVSQESGNRNELVWDDSLSGNFSHPAPSASPGVFPGVGGKQGMKIVNKNYSPDLTSVWAAQQAWWSTTSGAYQDS